MVLIKRTVRETPVYKSSVIEPQNIKIVLQKGATVHLTTEVKVGSAVLRQSPAGWVLVVENGLNYLETDDCPICLCDADGFKMPCCQKPLHSECFQMQLKAKWSGKLINFGFAKCPLCRADTFDHQHSFPKEIRELYTDLNDLKQNIKFLTEKKDAEVPPEERGGWAFFDCTRCHKPFCGGKVSCAEEHDLDAEEMVCGECKWQAQAQDHRCMEHGKRYAMFKCDSCCNIATFDCISNHYCEECHRRPGFKKFHPCPGEGKCPLGMPHPANHTAMHGRERTMGFVLGCFKCFDPNYEPLHYYNSGPDPFKELDEDNNKNQKFEQIFSYKKKAAVCPEAVPAPVKEEIDIPPPVVAPVVMDEEEESSAVAPANFFDSEPDDDSDFDYEEAAELFIPRAMKPNLSNISLMSEDTMNGLKFMEGFYHSDSEEEVEEFEHLLAPPQLIPVAS